MSSYPIFANLLTYWNVGYPLWTAPNASVLSCTFTLWLLKYGFHEGALNIFDTKVDLFFIYSCKIDWHFFCNIYCETYNLNHDLKHKIVSFCNRITSKCNKCWERYLLKSFKGLIKSVYEEKQCSNISYQCFLISWTYQVFQM